MLLLKYSEVVEWARTWPVTAGFVSGAGTWPATVGIDAGNTTGMGPGSAVVRYVGWTGMANRTSSLAVTKSLGTIGSARCPRLGHCQDEMAMAFSLMASWNASRLVWVGTLCWVEILGIFSLSTVNIAMTFSIVMVITRVEGLFWTVRNSET